MIEDYCSFHINRKLILTLLISMTTHCKYVHSAEAAQLT